MSTTVDNRVVEMQFDNKQFEKNISTSVSSIDKLNKSLKMAEGTKGLENVGAAAKKVDMSGLSSAVETVQLKFSSLQVMAVTALSNITNSAVNAGKRMVSALTIDPIKTGLSEYETQMNAVQTILANTESKGSTLKDVNGALDELNTYADKTIYNFTEMTKNIGTFTAAGVDLDTSVKSIKGIANLAAVSGSSSQQASTAMYQLSQALAAGKVSLMDWNSVVNAGMGGQVFQDALKRTAKNMGTDVDGLIKKYGSFRESLTQGEWLTADVLNKTLEQFTMAAEEGSKEWEKYKKSLMSEGYTEKQAVEILKMANTATDAATKVKTATQLWDTLKETAQSGWAQTWEIIFGDFEEAKEMFSNMYNTLSPLIEAMSKSRNDLLQGWKDGGGRTDLIDSLYNAFTGVMNIVKSFKNAVRQIFPPITSKQLIDITAKIKDLTEKFARLTNINSGSKFASNIGRVFKGIAAAFSIVSQVVKGLFSGIGTLLKRLAPTGSGLLEFAAGIGDILVKIDAFLKKGNVFTQFFKGIANVLGFVVNAISKFVGGVASLIKSIADVDTSGVDKFTDKMKARFHPLTVIAEGIKRVFVGMFNAVKKIFPIITAMASKIGELFSAMQERIATAIENTEYDSIFDMFNAGLITSILLAIRNMCKGASSLISDFGDFWDGIKKSLAEIKDAILDTFGAIQNNLNAGMLKKIATAIGILAVSLWLISTIDSEKLTKSLGSVAVLFAELLGATKIFLKITDSIKPDDIVNTINMTKVMKGLATSLLILAVAMKIMSTMGWEGMGVALISTAVGMGVLVGAVRLLPKDANLKQSAKAIKKLAKALVILAVALKIMSTMSFKEMGVALFSMATGLIAMVGAIRLLPKDAKLKQSVKAIKKLAKALVILAVALKIMSTMSFKEMGVALFSMATGLIAMVGAIRLLPKDAGIKALGMMAMATAMVILGSALKIMSSMSWKEMGVGLISMSVGLLAMVGAARLLPKDTGIKALGMIGMATAIVILGAAIKSMAGMSWTEMAKGLITLGAALLILSLAAQAMKSAVAGAAGMLIMAVALAKLTPQLKSLGSMSIGGLCVALIALAGAFLIIGVAAKLLGPMAGVLLKLSLAMMVFGVGVALVGVGILALSVGLTGLAGSIGAIATAIVGVISSLLSLIPYFFKQLAAGIVAFCEVISKGVPAIGEAIRAIVVTIIDILVECIPKIVSGILQLVTEVLASLVEYAPQIVGYVAQFLIKIIDTLAIYLPDLIQSFVNLLMALFQGTIDALSTVDIEVFKQGLIGVGILSALAAVLAGVAGMIPLAMIGVVGMGVIIAELALVLAAVGKLAQIPGLTDLVNKSGPLMQAVGTSIGSLVGGIIGGIGQGMTSTLPQIATNLSSFMTNLKTFIEGTKEIEPSALAGVKALVGVITTLTAAGVLDAIASFISGESSITKFANELVPLGKGIKGFSDAVAGIAPGPILAASTAAKALAEMTRTIPNSGGVASWFAGENSIAQFGTEIIELGKGLKGFSDSVAGISPENIVAAANAAKALALMAHEVPNEGGVASWFAGENSIANFGDDLINLGKGLKGFSIAITGIEPANIISAAEAAKALAHMADEVPNEGGVASWFAGENSIAKFGTDLVSLGKGLKGFSDAVGGVEPEQVAAATSAAKALCEMANEIPNSGGVASWFAGDNSISKFGGELKTLGTGLRDFSNEVSGVVPENILAAANAAKALCGLADEIPNSGGVVSWFAGDNSIANFGDDLIKLGVGLSGFSLVITGIQPGNIVAAANAAKAIADMASVIPNSGGVVSWFAGDNSISDFGGDLINLGVGLKGFSFAITGIQPENIVAAANAAKAIAEMTSVIPNSGGVASWFAGENSIAKFATELMPLGMGLRGFSIATSGIVPENIVAAANAAKAIAGMASVIPNSGGVASWFAGDNSIAKFATELIPLGIGLKGFSIATSGLVPENIIAAANAAKSLAQMTSYIPTEGGMKAWFAGETNVASFAKNLPELGKGLKGFSDELGDIEPDNITAGANAAKTLAEMTKTAPKNTNKLSSFGTNLVTFGGRLSSYYEKVKGISGDAIKKSSSAITTVSTAVSKLKAKDLTNTANAIKTLTSSLKGLNKINDKTVSGFSSAMSKIASTSISDMLDEFKNADTKMTNAGKNLIRKFIKGINGLSKDAKTAAKKIATGCNTSINSVKSNFKTSGKNLVKGFANGIELNIWIAKKAAKKMASDAAEAAKKELDEHSPSKVGVGIGKFFGLGFVNGIIALMDGAYEAGSDIASSARSGLSDSIGKVAELINSDIDTQPTIRPVMDLSGVRYGTDAINRMLDFDSSVGVMANVGSINSMMNQRLQNGSNSDVISAIESLGRSIGSMSGDTYQINGVTYDDGSNINNAVKTIVRAARIERRV